MSGQKANLIEPRIETSFRSIKVESYLSMLVFPRIFGHGRQFIRRFCDQPGNGKKPLAVVSLGMNEQLGHLNKSLVESLVNGVKGFS